MPLPFKGLRQSAADFYSKKRKNRSFSHPLEDLGVTYALHLYLVGKRVVDFIFVIIELFRYFLWLRRYKRKSVEIGVFRRGWVTLSVNFRRKGVLATNHCWYQKSTVIVVSYGVKISAVHCFVLSQSPRVADRRTDRQTDKITTPMTVIALMLAR